MCRHGARFDPAGLLLLVTLSACATDAADRQPRGLGGVRGQSVLAAAESFEGPSAGPQTAAAPADATVEVERPRADEVHGPGSERSLREELATAADPAPAALELADLLCALERHREALAAVDAALQRVDTPALQVCRAGLLRDLGRRREAADLLLGLAHNHGPAALHPGLLFECAELQWLLGDQEGAGSTLRSLEATHANDPWCTTNRAALDGLATELTTHTAPPRARVRDLLASLRGSGTVSERIRLLGELVALADSESGPRRDNLRHRAVAIACADESPSVRARAVQLADPAPEDREAFCAAALADAAPIVRRFAATRAVTCGAPAVPLLLAALEQESDPMAFAAIHDALATLVAEGPELAPLSANDPATRARVASDWRRRCNP